MCHIVQVGNEDESPNTILYMRHYGECRVHLDVNNGYSPFHAEPSAAIGIREAGRYKSRVLKVLHYLFVEILYFTTYELKLRWFPLLVLMFGISPQRNRLLINYQNYLTTKPFRPYGSDALRNFGKSFSSGICRPTGHLLKYNNYTLPAKQSIAWAISLMTKVKWYIRNVIKAYVRNRVVSMWICLTVNYILGHVS